MTKTKLGISVGFLAALTYFMGFFSGYTVLLLVVGYILIAEEDKWLRASAAKAVAVCVSFSLLSAFVNFLPDLMNLVDDICTIFGGHFYIAVIGNLVSFIQTVLSLAEKVILLVLGLMAFQQKTIRIDFLERLVSGEPKPAPQYVPQQYVPQQPVAPQAPQAPQAQPGMKICPHCGKQITADATFCPFCGKN